MLEGDMGRMLGLVGITETEEALYMALLDRPGATVSELSQLHELPRKRTELALESLERKGLVSHSPGSQRRHFPSPPDVAVETLIVKRQAALQQVRLVVTHLQEKARKGRSLYASDDRVVEIITGREAQGEVFEQMQRSAQKELICFDRPPYVWSPEVVENKTEYEVLGRGVRCRGIYDSRALEMPGAAERIYGWVKSGEEARVYPTVPIKMTAADRRIAMLPLDVKQIDGAAMLIRPCSLLNALYDLFDVIWEQSAPISFTATGEVEIGEPATNMPPDAERLIPLLAAGLRDKNIADQLDISPRTLDRHITKLMKCLNARTRFQAGWLAALRLSRTLH